MEGEIPADNRGRIAEVGWGGREGICNGKAGWWAGQAWCCMKEKW